MAKRCRYQDFEIRTLKGKKYYLRVKQYDKIFLLYSVRTQRNGQGKCLARTRTRIDHEAKAIKRLFNAWRKFTIIYEMDAIKFFSPQ